MPEPGREAVALSQEQIASMYAHHVVAELIRYGVRPLSQTTAAAAHAGIQVTVIVGPFAPFAVAPTDPPPVLPTTGLSRGRLRDVEAAILENCPGPNKPPISIKALARRADYSYTPFFRAAVNALVERGAVVRVRGGVRRSDTARQSPTG
jgi:hypothetical protein